MIKSIVLNDYELTNLDKMVIEFSSILGKYSDYVIVSGYLAIVFGNARETLDVDFIYKDMKGKEEEFSKEIKKNFYWSEKDIEKALKKGERMSIFHRKSDWYIDLKKASSIFDEISIKDRIKLLLNDKEIFVSPIELQICYKISQLGSDKDIKDASYLYEFFKEKIDKKKLKEYARMMGADLSVIEG